jgi:hypothetical protein
MHSDTSSTGTSSPSEYSSPYQPSPYQPSPLSSQQQCPPQPSSQQQSSQQHKDPTGNPTSRAQGLGDLSKDELLRRFSRDDLLNLLLSGTSNGNSASDAQNASACYESFSFG